MVKSRRSSQEAEGSQASFHPGIITSRVSIEELPPVADQPLGTGLPQENAQVELEELDDEVEVTRQGSIGFVSDEGGLSGDSDHNGDEDEPSWFAESRNADRTARKSMIKSRLMAGRRTSADYGKRISLANPNGVNVLAGKHKKHKTSVDHQRNSVIHATKGPRLSISFFRWEAPELSATIF